MKYLAAVLALLALVLVAAQVPTVPVESDHGWAGPHPEQLVSFHVLHDPKKGNKQDYQLLANTSGSGFVLTRVVFGSGTDIYLRAKENTIKTRLEVYYQQVNSGIGLVDRDLSPGVRFSSGGPVSVQIESPNLSSLTLIGYRH